MPQPAGHLPLVAVTRLPEALLEVVGEEGVEHGVDGGVGVMEAVAQQDHDHQGVALVVARRLAAMERETVTTLSVSSRAT